MSSTLSSIRSSPLPDLAFDSYHSGGQRGLREQALMRRTIVNNNQQQQQEQAGLPGGFTGHVVLNKSGRPLSFISVNGEKFPVGKYSGESFAFWILLSILIILVIINATLTFVVFGVLRMGVGMESIEIVPNVIKFFGLTDLGDIFKNNGLIEGFGDQPMVISGEGGGRVEFQIQDDGPSLSLGPGGINISKVSEFRLVDRKGREVFSTNKPSLGLPEGVKFLDVKVAKVNRITSGINETLTLRTTTFAYMKGSEGTHLDGKEIAWSADQDIFLKSVSGKLVISGKEGVLLDVNSLPLVRESGVTRKSYTYQTQGKREAQYQLCICMPEGLLFKIAIPLGNNNARPDQRIGCHSATNFC